MTLKIILLRHRLDAVRCTVLSAADLQGCADKHAGSRRSIVREMLIADADVHR